MRLHEFNSGKCIHCQYPQDRWKHLDYEIGTCMTSWRGAYADLEQQTRESAIARAERWRTARKDHRRWQVAPGWASVEERSKPEVVEHDPDPEAALHAALHAAGAER